MPDSKELLGDLAWVLRPVAEVTLWHADTHEHVPHYFEVNPEETIESLWARVIDSLEGSGQHTPITLKFMTTLQFHERGGRYTPPNATGHLPPLDGDHDRDAWVRTAYLAWSVQSALAGKAAGTFREHLDKLGLSDVGTGPAFSGGDHA